MSHVQCTIVHTQTHQHVKVEQYSSNRGNYPSALKYLAGNQDKVAYSFLKPLLTGERPVHKITSGEVDNDSSAHC